MAFSQLAQLGNFWSHLFFRRRQRLQALTLRKLLLWPTFALAPPSCFVPPARPALSGGPSPCCSLVAGDGPEVATLRDGGESFSDRLSGEDCLNRLAGCICGEGRELSGIFFRRDGRFPGQAVEGGSYCWGRWLDSKLILGPPLSAGVHSLSPPGLDLDSGSGLRIGLGLGLEGVGLGEDDVDFDGLRNEGLVGWMQAEGRQTDSLPEVQ